MGKIVLFAALVLFAFPAIAEDAKKPSTYSPDYCEFTATFPSEPYITQRCDEEGSKQCYDMVSYTQVFDMTETVNFRVICNKIDESVYKTYSPEIMAATLRAMTDQTLIKTFDTTFREEEGYKQAGLIGEGKSGRLSTIYIAQLWIGSHSAFSVEAEMIGDASERAENLFRDVLQSVQFTGEKKPEENKEEPKKEPKKEEEKDKE
jgi:hypothetical protein